MNETYFDDRLHKALKDATYAIQDYIEEYRDKEDYLTRLKFILFALVSSTIEVSEIRGDCSAEYIWSELENMAKEGGLTAISEKIRRDREYSISDITPDDFASGMNYLGQHVATALYKHIHDLPIQQRKPEMFLRALEAAMANVLNHKFAEYDKHKIIDNFCEHIHMGLNDKSSRMPNNPTKSNIPPTSKQKEESPKIKTNDSALKNQNSDIMVIVAKINQQALVILANGGVDTLFDNLPQFFPDVSKILHHADRDKIDDIYDEYEGFYEVMKMFETVAGGLQSGKIKVD